jgi:hypothetical protein
VEGASNAAQDSGRRRAIRPIQGCLAVPLREVHLTRQTAPHPRRSAWNANCRLRWKDEAWRSGGTRQPTAPMTVLGTVGHSLVCNAEDPVQVLSIARHIAYRSCLTNGLTGRKLPKSRERTTKQNYLSDVVVFITAWISSNIVGTWIFEGITIKKNAVFWDVAPCASCKNRRFGRTYRLDNQGDKNRWTRNNVSRN